MNYGKRLHEGNKEKEKPGIVSRIITRILKRKEPQFENYFGFLPGSSLATQYCNKGDLAVPSDIPKRNEFGFPITGKK